MMDNIEVRINGVEITGFADDDSLGGTGFVYPSKEAEMTTPKDDGGPAFPKDYQVNPYNGEQYWHSEGMTLRDWFAGQALMGMVATKPYEDTPVTKAEAARHCYEMAAAMIAARNAN